MQLTLSHWSLLLGVLLLAKGVFALAARDRAVQAAQGFARHVWAGRILATLAWVWAGWATYTMPLEFIVSFRSWIPVMTLVAIPLSWYWMADLLGCRAVGGLLVLFPCPLFLASNANPSPLRLVLVIFAYLAIVVGMTLILYPYYLRRWLAWCATRPIRLQVAGAISAALGALFVTLGLTAFH
jgi:hypothetical protein